MAEYRLTLGAGNVAILQLVADNGWAMAIAHGPGRPDTERGLFGTPHDALMVLVAEFVFSGNPLEHPEAEAGADDPPAEMRDSA